jgi:hypothetical protein
MKNPLIRNENLLGPPGLHAFIVGVSDYKNLPLPGEPLAPHHLGLRKLSSAALSAYKMYCWLLEHQNDLAVPLVSCRLLLSPSATEIAAAPEIGDLADPATVENFLVQAAGWQNDANSNEGDMTLFYFSGHGAQQSRDDAVLLLEDFGDGVGVPLRKAVDVNNIFNGMARSNQFRTIAQKQLYFIDACRDFLSAFKNLEPQKTTQVFQVQLSGEDTRVAPIFYAAAPGTGALAIPGQQTLFSKALIDCLNGDAGQFEEVEGQERWNISVHSLCEVLLLKMQELNARFGEQQEFLPGGWWKDTVICFLDHPPLVKVKLKVEPQEAVPCTRIMMMDLLGAAPAIPFPLNPYPYEGAWPAGYYTLSAEIVPPAVPYVNVAPFIRQIVPPHFSRTMKVIP